MGIPVIGCTCAVCTSTNPKNKRLRPSALLRFEGKTLLIDAGPDLRTQALLYGINRLDGVILTHCHHDHTAGVDDLRVYYMWQKSPVPLLCSDETERELKSRFTYIFNADGGKLVPKLDLTVLPADRGEIRFLGVKVGFTSYEQTKNKVTGFKFGPLAYVTDISDYGDEVFDDLAGTKVLVISALRKEKSPVHFSMDEAVEFGRWLGVEKLYMIHFNHEVEHEEATKELPSFAHLAYDGLELQF